MDDGVSEDHYSEDEFRGPPSAEELAAWRSAAKVGNVDAIYNLGIICYQSGSP